MTTIVLVRAADCPRNTIKALPGVAKDEEFIQALHEAPCGVLRDTRSRAVLKRHTSHRPNGITSRLLPTVLQLSDGSEKSELFFISPEAIIDF